MQMVPALHMGRTQTRFLRTGCLSKARSVSEEFQDRSGVYHSCLLESAVVDRIRAGNGAGVEQCGSGSGTASAGFITTMASRR